MLRLCVEKGSVAFDGVSVTLAELVPSREVNPEADVLAKYVERFVRPA